MRVASANSPANTNYKTKLHKRGTDRRHDSQFVIAPVTPRMWHHVQATQAGAAALSAVLDFLGRRGTARSIPPNGNAQIDTPLSVGIPRIVRHMTLPRNRICIRIASTVARPASRLASRIVSVASNVDPRPRCRASQRPRVGPVTVHCSTPLPCPSTDRGWRMARRKDANRAAPRAGKQCGHQTRDQFISPKSRRWRPMDFPTRQNELGQVGRLLPVRVRLHVLPRTRPPLPGWLGHVGAVAIQFRSALDRSAQRLQGARVRRLPPVANGARRAVPVVRVQALDRSSVGTTARATRLPAGGRPV